MEAKVSGHQLIFSGFVRAELPKDPKDSELSYSAYETIVEYPLKGVSVGESIEVRISTKIITSCTPDLRVGVHYIFFLTPDSSGRHYLRHCDATTAYSLGALSGEIEKVKLTAIALDMLPPNQVCAKQFPTFAECFGSPLERGDLKCGCTLSLDSITNKEELREAVLCGRAFKEGDIVLDVELKRISSRTVVMVDGRRTACVKRPTLKQVNPPQK